MLSVNNGLSVVTEAPTLLQSILLNFQTLLGTGEIGVLSATAILTVEMDISREFETVTTLPQF